MVPHIYTLQGVVLIGSPDNEGSSNPSKAAILSARVGVRVPGFWEGAGRRGCVLVVGAVLELGM